MTPSKRWTLKDIEREKEYRIQERLGMMVGSGEPTEEQLEIARREADDWEFTRSCKAMGIDWEAK